MQTIRCVFFIVWGIVFFLTSAWGAEGSSLTFFAAGKSVGELTLSELKTRLTVQEIRFFDPLYNKEKRFAVFAIADVLQLAYGERWLSATLRSRRWIATSRWRGWRRWRSRAVFSRSTIWMYRARGGSRLGAKRQSGTLLSDLDRHQTIPAGCLPLAVGGRMSSNPL